MSAFVEQHRIAGIKDPLRSVPWRVSLRKAEPKVLARVLEAFLLQQHDLVVNKGRC